MIEEGKPAPDFELDEVGTGTDPEEGSALGVAVVDHFKKRGAHVVATTHYSGLKMYAANEPGVLNASVEFEELSSGRTATAPLEEQAGGSP